MLTIALAAAIALTVAAVGVLVLTRGPNHVNQRGATNAARTASPSPAAESPGLIAPSPTPNDFESITAISTPSSEVVWALVQGMTQNGDLYRSVDSGQTWELRPGPPLGQLSIHFAFVDDQEGWLLATTGLDCRTSPYVWHTSDAGTTWQKLPISGSGNQCHDGISFGDSRHGVMTASDGNNPPTVYRTSDGGRTWAASVLPDPPGFVKQGTGFGLSVGMVQQFGQTVLLTESTPALMGFYFFQSVDDGARWSYVATLQNQNALPAIAFVTPSRWLSIMPGALGPAPGFPSLETTDQGKSWHTFTTDYYRDPEESAPQFVFADSASGYGTIRGDLWRTQDGGPHWSLIKFPGS